jgi:Tfp pilus assembly protein PilF
MVGLAVLVLTGGGLVLWKKIAKHGPPPAAVETLATATSAAVKDTMASLADAETKAKDALDLAGPKSYFPQAVATLARIEIQWSDALNDQASFWTDMAQTPAEAGNDAKKTEAESKVVELQNQAKARLKIAFETIAPAYKADPKSPDLELALADYYRAQRSNSNMNRELRKAQALKTEEPRIALVQGLAAAQEEDGAEKAISKLKTALNANASSARIHFRLAMAYLAAKDDDNAMKELKETLRISPQHERAKMAMEQLAAAPAEQK